MITPAVRHQLPHTPLCGITSTPASTSPRTRPSRVRAVGRSFRPSPTDTGGAVLPARRMYLPASRPSTDLSTRRIMTQNHAGGMCPFKHIWRDGPRMTVSAKPGGCGFTNKLPTHRGSVRGLNPAGLCFAMECPGAFRSWSGGWLRRTVRSGTTTVAIGVTNRLIQFLTDLRSGCASSSATTLKCTPGTPSGLSRPISLRSEHTGGAVMLMRETLRNLQSESSARTPGPAKAPPRGRGSGLSFRRFAQGWRLWTIQLKAGPTAGIDLGTAEHGDRRLLPPFGRTLQGSGHSNLRGVISRLRQCPQGRCQSAHQAGRLTMPLKLTLRMATLPL